MSKPAALTFEQAAALVKTQTSIKVSDTDKLQLYALYKRATAPTAKPTKPSIFTFDLTAHPKYNAWNDAMNIQQAEAKSKYIALVTRLFVKR